MRLDGPNTISLLPGLPDQYCPRGRTCDVPETSRLLHLPAYPTGWWKKAGGCERFPVMASEAFSTWSDEQLKSEKSLHWTGKCIVTAEIGSMAVLAIPEDFSSCCSFSRTAWCTDLGNAAKALSVGCEKTSFGRSLMSANSSWRSARKITLSSYLEAV